MGSTPMMAAQWLRATARIVGEMRCDEMEHTIESGYPASVRKTTSHP